MTPTLFSPWSFEPSVIVPLALAAVLYWRGSRGSALHVVGGRKATRRWQAASFYLGLLVVFVALESPLDSLDGTLFSAHMAQHLLLMMVAAPLMILGDSTVPLMRGIPLGFRRRVLGTAGRHAGIRSFGHALSWLTRPQAVFVIYLVDLYLWHWNRLFNLTLQNQVVHDLEHVCFLVTAYLFWSQIIDQRTMRSRLSYTQRVVYLVLTGAVSNLLAMYFVFAPRAVYSTYLQVIHRPYGITALGDQQVAGMLMWIPVLWIFATAFAVCLYKALGQDEPDAALLASSTSTYSVLPTTEERPAGSLSLVDLHAQGDW